MLSSRALRASIEYQQLGSRVVRYIKGSNQLGLRLGGRDKELKLFGFSDASHRIDGNSKPQLGTAIFGTKDSGAIETHSKRGQMVVGSVMLAELLALTYLIIQLLSSRQQCKELGFE